MRGLNVVGNVKYFFLAAISHVLDCMPIIGTVKNGIDTIAAARRRDWDTAKMKFNECAFGLAFDALSVSSVSYGVATVTAVAGRATVTAVAKVGGNSCTLYS